MRPETLTRYELVSGTTHMKVLLDHDSLHIEALVTLDGDDPPDRRWKVVAKYEAISTKSIKRSWNNNI